MRRTAGRTTTAILMGACVLPLALAGCSKKEEPVGTGAPGTSTGAVNQGPTITIANFAFSPEKAEAKVNQTVTWKNDQGVAHTITDANLTGASVIKSAPVQPDQTYVLSFDKPGTYAYICSIHPSQMKGEIVVTA